MIAMGLTQYISCEREHYKMSENLKSTLKNVGINIVVELGVLAIVAIVGNVARIAALPDRFASLEAKVDNLQSLETRVTKLEDNQVVGGPTIYNFNGARLQPKGEIIQTETQSAELAYVLAPPAWTSDDIIAEDGNTGERFSAKQLANQKLLLPYYSDGKEIIFYGQYNDNNQWDGTCIINTYKNDDLEFIMEAEYDNGTLLSYKQVQAATLSGNDIWRVSERISEKTYNSGDTWTYFRDGEYEKEFNFDEVQAKDVIAVEEFKSYIGDKIEGYYHGNTSNGYYNDTTGNAYLVKYNTDGKVRLLYVGNFKNGQCEDYTGNAWHIAKEENTTYMYYRGFFDSGKVVNNEGYFFKNFLTLEDIEEYIGDLKFNCKLNWDF